MSGRRCSRSGRHGREHYNSYSPEQVSCRSLKEQGIDREPERHLGPKMARPDAPEAGKVMGTREDLKNLAKIEREMVKLSREIEKARLDQVKQPPQVMTASDMLNEVRAYSKTFEALDTARSGALHELREQRAGPSLPYREEAIKRHVTQKWQPHWEKLNKKVENYNNCLKAHEEAGNLTKVGWDLGKSYNKAADKLTIEAVTLKYEQKQLREYEAREKEDLSNPHNIHAHGKHEVDKLAHKLAQERDPDYQNKKATIERQEEKIIAARQISQPEIKRVRELCRHLAKLDSQQQVTLTMPLDRILKSPDIVNKLNQGFEKRYKAMEHDKTKTIERDRGMER